MFSYISTQSRLVLLSTRHTLCDIFLWGITVIWLYCRISMLVGVGKKKKDSHTLGDGRLGVTSDDKWCFTDEVHLFRCVVFWWFSPAKNRHFLCTFVRTLTFTYRHNNCFSFCRVTSIMTIRLTSTMLRLKQHLATTKKQKRYLTSSTQPLFRDFY